MSRRPKVDYVRDLFLGNIESARNLVQAVGNLPVAVQTTVGAPFHPRYKEQVVALAFMGVIAAWEEFLELTLVRYLAGAQTQSGYAPRLKYGRANSIKHAYQILSGKPNFNPNQSYLKSDHSWILKMADFHFSRHPYTQVRKYNNLLINAVYIRNRIAHNSQKSKSDFRRAALWFLQPSGSRLEQGFSPGKLLQRPVQGRFPPQISQSNPTHFEAFLLLFDDLANKIVP